jgi:hypothetical protein
VTNTTWSSTDRLNCTIGGTNNLTVSNFTAAGALRTIDRQLTGKFYIEYTCTTWTANVGIGLANAGVVLSTMGTTGANGFTVGTGGNVSVNGVATGTPIGARANGDIIGIAVDLTNALGWMRVAPAGNWNGSATADPATGAGGVSLAIVSSSRPLYGLVYTNAAVATASITANFGDTAFSGAVPSGFTAGLVAGATPPLYEMATQAALEQWSSGTPLMQATQIAVEQWATVATGNTAMSLTQASLEVWASVALVSAARAGPRQSLIM